MAVAVECDTEAEGVEDASLCVGVGCGEGVSEVGEGVEDLAGVVEGGLDGVVLAGIECHERSLGFAAFGLERGDAVADEVGVDAGFDRAELEADALVDVVELVLEAATSGRG